MKNMRYVMALILVIFYLVTVHYFSRDRVPDFAAMTDVKKKKESFFEYMYPRIEIANIQLLDLRTSLIVLQNKLHSGNRLSPGEREFILLQTKKYRIKFNHENSLSTLNKLLTKVDIVPPSLALAQSANESAWGTSRFALHGSNYFGQWCYTKGCGIVPSSRDSGANHEVRKFGSVQESVSSYVYNINSGSAYSQLRSIRSAARAKETRFGGYGLASGLGGYSERGEAYVEEIREMILFNRLNQYDDRFWRLIERRGK